METFSALLSICAGNSPVPGEFLAQRPVTRSFDVFFDLHPNELVSKHCGGWWFETPSCPLWRHRNVKWHISPTTNIRQEMFKTYQPENGLKWGNLVPSDNSIIRRIKGFSTLKLYSLNQWGRHLPDSIFADNAKISVIEVCLKIPH